MGAAVQSNRVDPYVPAASFLIDMSGSWDGSIATSAAIAYLCQHGRPELGPLIWRAASVRRIKTSDFGRRKGIDYTQAVAYYVVSHLKSSLVENTTRGVALLTLLSTTLGLIIPYASKL